MDYRILHIADLHLDSPLKGLRQHEGAPAERLFTATRASFSRLVDLAIEREVAVVLIAGDVFDGEWRDINTGLFFLAELRRLERAGLPVVMIRGNHDAKSRISRELTLPESCRLLGHDAAETVPFDELDLAVHGQSFAREAVTDNIARGYPAPSSRRLNIGLLHTGLESGEGHARYAPCTPDELARHGYDYWALGHVHDRRVVAQAPWIVYSGNIQGRHVGETGAKGGMLLHVEGGRIAKVEPVDTAEARWHRLALDATGIEAAEEVPARIQALIDEAAMDAQAELNLVRVELGGSPVCWQEILRDAERLREQVLERFAGDERFWIERIALEPAPPASAAAGGSEALDLIERMLAEAPEDEELRTLMRRELDAILAKLEPRELKEEIAAESTEQLGPAIETASRRLRAMLKD